MVQYFSNINFLYFFCFCIVFFTSELHTKFWNIHRLVSRNVRPLNNQSVGKNHVYLRKTFSAQMERTKKKSLLTEPFYSKSKANIAYDNIMHHFLKPEKMLKKKRKKSNFFFLSLFFFNAIFSIYIVRK
jgi:hypothetical protein